MSTVNHGIDRVRVTVDEDHLVADAGLLATLAARLGLEGLINTAVRLTGRVGGAVPGRKVLDVIARPSRSVALVNRRCRAP